MLLPFGHVSNDAGEIDSVAVDNRLAHTRSGLVTFDLHRHSFPGWQKACRLFYHACFATRLGGVSGETQGWRDSSHTAMVGGGKFGSAKAPIATATYPGKPSPSQ
jgi:hypothetical protein